MTTLDAIHRRAMILMALLLSGSAAALPVNGSSRSTQEASSVSAGVASVATAPDLFTGNLAQTIPIQVVPGRRGMQPDLALRYRSSGGNGFAGVGWDLDLGSVERRTKDGLSYSADDFVLHSGGAAIDLVSIGPGEYRARFENGAFLRVRQIPASLGQTYWEVTDRGGTKRIYGTTRATRQDDPADASRIFRWCLERAQDPDGNFLTVTYFKAEAQIYPSRIDYTGWVDGAGNVGLSATNSVTFGWEDGRPDAPPSRALFFLVRTGKRLSTVDVFAGAQLVRRYQLSYATSANSSRSLLVSFTQVGKDMTSTLPAMTFQYTSPAAGMSWSHALSGWFGAPWDTNNLIHTADVNGDGYDDIVLGPDSSGNVYLMIGSASGIVPLGFRTGSTLGPFSGTPGRIRTMDFDGDGRTDLLIGPDGAGTFYVMRSTGPVNNPTFAAPVAKSTPFGSPWDLPESQSRIRAMDLNRDGKTDLLIGPDSGGNWYWVLSDGTNFLPPIRVPSPYGAWGDDATQKRVFPMDVNGDGLVDIVLGPDGDPFHPGTGGKFYVMENTGSGFIDRGAWFSNPNFAVFATGDNPGFIKPMDVNGDGKMDLVIGPNSSGQWFVLRSTGTSFEDLSNSFTTPWPSVYGGAWADVATMSRIRPVDANNDGLTDILLGPDHAGTWYLLQSTGSGFIDRGAWLTIPEIASTAWDLPESQGRIRQIDVNGDGRQDVLVGPDSSGNWWIGSATAPYPDLLSVIQNGYGGSASIAYTPSTRFQQVLLPFAIQVPTSVTVNDGTGAPAASATTEYQYFNGYFLLRDREFRGFAQTTVLGQPWPGGARARTTTFFRQGNGYDPTASGILDAAADDPSQSPGYARGTPWKVLAEDTASSAYSVTETRNKIVAGAPSYFVSATDVNSKYCSANVCGRQSRQTMEYADGYGNVTREDHYGDINDSTDDFTIQRVFALNTTDWIIALPARETTYAGAGAVLGNRIAEINFDYDGTTTDCAIHPVRTPIPPPIRGNRTRVSSWLDTGPSNPETVMSYDSYGNVVCSRDPLGNITRTAYDSTRTFSVSATNALGHVATSKYYGVDGVPWSSSALDPGLYGYVQSTTDPNLATTSFQYDVFGRKKSETGPDNFTTTWSYNTLGTVGRRGFAEGQNQGVSSPAGMSETYFDGLGRITLKRGRGSATAPWIAEQTDYLATASLGSKSEPYFYGTETARFTTYAYDVNGRPVSVTAPDGTVVTTCRDDMVGVTVVVDPNKHRRRETRDVNGRVRRIEEYLGNFPTCTTDVGTPYATTLYSPDVLGRMTQITPAKGQPIGMTYDSLGRKRSTSDPHLGTWTYDYDANGNLVTQVDQRGATTSFQYDPLNRPISKTVTLNTVTPPPPTLSVTYKYDLGPFGIGRLSQRTESSGSNVTGSIALSYDTLGRVVSSTQAIGSRGFTTSATFDAARRPLTTTFPDGVVVTSAYDAQGRLAQLSDPTRVYGNFPANCYDAYGRAATINFGDGTTSSYTFEPSSARLRRILTTTSTSAPLLDLTYQYDLVGNITAILDGVDSSASQSFAYDELNRLVRAQSSSYASSPATLSYAYDVTRVQALTSTSDGRNYSYDPNGNLVGDGQRTLVWDPENRLASVTLGAATTTLTYDDAGARLKKDGSSGTVLYASAQFECATPPGGVETCTRYIVGNGIRLASVAGTTVRYFHLDHLGSTRVVTSAQEVVERASYRPFGLTLSDTASGGSREKFSAKELDAETGFYNYGARYYDPALGRFVSADSVLQNVLDPQLLNRYAYARNNPVLLADPSGHFVIAPFLAAVIIGAVVGGVSAGIASNWNLDQMWKGALVGAVGAAAGYGLGPVVGKVLGDATIAVIAGGAICGAATGATAGGLAAGLAGGNVLAGMGQGALYGAIGGAIGGGFRTIPGLKALPNAAASTAGSAITGFIECGPGCAARSAASSLASSMAMDLNAAFGPRTEERVSQLNSRTERLARQHLALIANDPVLAEGGYTVTLGDTYRSSEAQQRDYESGNSRAPPGRSYHEFRAAYDLNIYDANGTYVRNPQDPGLLRIGELGRSVGLEWGGNWTQFIDMYHFQYSGGVPVDVFGARYRAGLDPYTGR